MDNISKEQYFLANFTDNKKDNIAMNIFMDLFRYIVGRVN
jgi:hypothetical protein